MADKDSLGPEALLQASSDCKYRLVRLLIDGGTLANVRNENQETPLILACKSESEEKEKVVDYLIRKRVKVNLQDVHGRTALMHACLTNSPDNVIRMLVNCKANPWLVDESNNTAFDYAINAGNIGTVKLMIQACREGKILTKPGSFNIEMKRLEDRLDEMPETRKCSWPLMGPRNSAGKEKRSTNNKSNLLAVSEVDEFTESPTRERRRKRSICHFDPIELDGSEEAGEISESATKQPLRRTISRSASEDERISLHFSDSDNSSFDRSSTNFSSLEKLLRMRDSVTSSVDSNDSVNAQNLQIKVEGIKEEKSSKNNEISADEVRSSKQEEEHSRKNINNDNTNVEKLNQSQTDFKSHSEKTSNSDKTQETAAGIDRRKIITKESEVKSNRSEQTREELMKSSSALTCGMSIQNPVSPRTPRRRTVGSLTPSQKGDVIDDWERKRTGNESEATRRVTIGAMDMRSEDRRRSLNLWSEEHNFRPSPPPRDLLSSASRKPLTFVTSHEKETNRIIVSSPEMKSFRKKIRSPEVDFTHGNSPDEHAQELCKKLENTGIQTSPDSAKGRKLDALKTNALFPFNLPAISSPENIECKGKEREGKESGKSSQVEKTVVRRTLSDNVSHERRRASATGARGDYHGNGQEESTSACVVDFTAAAGTLITRERSASFTPLSTTACTTSPQEHKPNVSTCCDIVTMATTGEPPRSHCPRNKLSSDLPDLVLHTPRSPRVRSPSNLDPFSLTPELQVTDPIHTRYARSAPSSSDTLNPTGSPTYFTGSNPCASKPSNSYNHLPEVVSGTTGSPKQRRVAFLPPLNISRKQQDQPEEGYFSCSPSPLEVESPNRSKEKSKYSFKPSSPRLMNRPVKNLLP